MMNKSYQWAQDSWYLFSSIIEVQGCFTFVCLGSIDLGRELSCQECRRFVFIRSISSWKRSKIREKQILRFRFLFHKEPISISNIFFACSFSICWSSDKYLEISTLYIYHKEIGNSCKHKPSWMCFSFFHLTLKLIVIAWFI